MELARVISEQLKKYINDPQVTVSVTEINSRRIYVNGEVTKAGAYALLPHMTILQALSSSGGFTHVCPGKKHLCASHQERQADKNTIQL